MLLYVQSVSRALSSTSRRTWRVRSVSWSFIRAIHSTTSGERHVVPT